MNIFDLALAGAMAIILVGIIGFLIQLAFVLTFTIFGLIMDFVVKIIDFIQGNENNNL